MTNQVLALKWLPIKVTACSIFAATHLVFLKGCTVTDPGGGKWEVGPRERRAPGPTNGIVVGTFVGPDGKTYLLIDVNGDGVPDFAQVPDGIWRKITPPNQPYPQNPSASQTASIPNRPYSSNQPLSPLAPNQGASNSWTPVSPIPWNPWDAFWSGFTDWNPGIDPPMPFDFTGRTAGEWLAFYGMDIPAGEVAETEGLQLNLFDTSTMYTDMTFFTSSDFALPDIHAFDLDYEFSWLFGAPADPDFIVLRVAGDFAEVVKFAFEIGDGVQTFSFTAGGDIWSVVADETAMTATLYQDGVYYTHMDID